MAKTIIPGLSFVPTDEEEERFIEISSFFGETFKVPQSHRVCFKFVFWYNVPDTT